jgi:putative ATP-dependent endonuclease of OLD family
VKLHFLHSNDGASFSEGCDMQIRSVEVKGLRSIKSVNIGFHDVTVLIGGNNAGKSTIFHALRMFFEAAPKVNADDFHKRETDKIEIIVTFDRLTADEVAEFGNAVLDGRMTISRTFSNDRESNLTYSVLTKVFPEFNAIRSEGNKTSLRSAFNAIARDLEIEPATTADQAIALMDEWELKNPHRLERSFLRGFFGAPNVANGKLRKKTNLHFIPAVVNVSDETSETKKSPIINLLSDIARQTFENRQEVKDFLERVQTGFSDLTSPDRFPQLMKVSDVLTAGIRKYYADSRLLADWVPDEGIKVSYPKPVIRVEDGGFTSGLENVGHGLQRAALFSVVEFLATGATADGDFAFDEAQSDIILLIEEPEIYQHPHKQKIISDAFRKLCATHNRQTGIRFQVMFATHSEKFVDISTFHTARVIRRSVDGEDYVHSVSELSVEACSHYFGELLDRQPMPEAAFLAKLHIFSREICEGFFARKVILVEGVTDKAVLEGVYRSLGRDNLLEGISIISVEGKTKMDKPFYIFNKLGIPAFAVFDSDRNKRDQRTRINILLQRIANVADPEEFPDGCFEKFCSFSNDLEDYAKAICGDQWLVSFKSVADEFGLEIGDICKTPHAIERVFCQMRQNGHNFALLDEVIAKVDAL